MLHLQPGREQRYAVTCVINFCEHHFSALTTRSNHVTCTGAECTEYFRDMHDCMSKNEDYYGAAPPAEDDEAEQALASSDEDKAPPSDDSGVVTIATEAAEAAATTTTDEAATA